MGGSFPTKGGIFIDLINIQRKKILLATFISFVTAVGASATCGMLSKDVTIIYDDKNKTVTTFRSDVDSVLKKENISIGKDDKVLPNLDSKLEDGMNIKIKRAKNINLTLNNQSKELITTSESVDELIKEQNLKLSSLDIVIPSLNHKIKSKDNIQVVRVKEQILTKNQSIPYTLETVYDDTLELGKIEKVQQGAYGEKELSYKVVLNDGKEISRELVAEKIITNPQNEVIKKGTKNFIVTSRGDIKRYTKIMNVVATAYTAGYESTGKRPGDKDYGKTCTGTKVRPGVIAVDPNIIPFGSKVYIEQLGMVAIAEDRGGAIKGNKIDIFMSDVGDARRFGVKNMKIYILE